MSGDAPWVPVISMALTGGAVALFAVAGTPAQLLLEAGVVWEEPWRLVTGHWVHLSWNHLFWDGAAFAMLASVVERESRTRLLLVLALATAAVSTAVVVGMPWVSAYGGLSGIDAALVAAVAVSMIRAGGSDRKVGAALGLAFAAKLVWEQLSGGVVFAGEAGMNHATAVHGIGAVAGALGALLPSVSWRGLCLGLRGLRARTLRPAQPARR